MINKNRRRSHRRRMNLVLSQPTAIRLKIKQKICFTLCLPYVNCAAGFKSNVSDWRLWCEWHDRSWRTSCRRCGFVSSWRASMDSVRWYHGNRTHYAVWRSEHVISRENCTGWRNHEITMTKMMTMVYWRSFMNCSAALMIPRNRFLLHVITCARRYCNHACLLFGWFVCSVLVIPQGFDNDGRKQWPWRP